MCDPIRQAQTATARRQRNTSLAISLALSLCSCGLATKLYAENCFRKPLDAKFNFATWAKADQSRAVLVNFFDEESFDLRLSPPDSAFGVSSIQAESSSSRRANDLFLEERHREEDNEPLDEVVYALRPYDGGFVGVTMDKKKGVLTSTRWYDTSLRLLAETKLQSRVGMTGELIADNRVMAMLDWQPVGDRFFAYGTLGKAGRLDAYEHGFFITQVQTPDNHNVTPMADMVLPMTPAYAPYAFRHPYIAVDGNLVYFLEIASQPVLHHYNADTNRVGWFRTFPQANTPIPYPPVAASTQDRYKSLESVELPVGLYYHYEKPGASEQFNVPEPPRGFLYVLWRKPLGNGQSSYNVIQLAPNPDTGELEVKGEVRLPTTSEPRNAKSVRHVFLMPGNGSWLMLEAGSITAGKPRIQLLAAVTIPEHWITRPKASKLSVQSLESVACMTSP